MPKSLPNFLIIGDLKCASTSLYQYLKQHPSIYMAEPKELRYFAFDPNNEYHARAHSTIVRTWDEYLSHFKDSGDYTAIGEASPNYLRSPGAAKRIMEVLPRVKLIVSIRNPADRLYSLYQMHARAGSADYLPFDQYAFRNDACWIKGNYYWSDLKRYFDIFQREQIMVLLFEDIVGDPVRVSQEIYDFLGVNPAFTPTTEVHNPGGVPKNRVAYSILVNAGRVLKRVVRPSKNLKRYWSGALRSSLDRAPLDSKLRQQLLDVCEDDIMRTQELIGRDLSSWLQ